jgi:hypothetical protein
MSVHAEEPAGCTGPAQEQSGAGRSPGPASQREPPLADVAHYGQVDAVMQTLDLELHRLPEKCTNDARTEKLARPYAHAYDHYF